MVQLLKSSGVTIRRALLPLIVLLVAGCGSPEQRAQNYYERGMQLLAQHEYVKAGIEFKNALQLKKDLVGAWRGLLEIESHNGSIQGAVPILGTIVELDPKDIDARLRLGHFLMAGGALGQALDQANAAIALDGKNPKAVAFRGAVLLKLKDNVGAKREAQAALDIDPNNAEALIVLAMERSASGDSQGGLLILNRPGLTHEKDDELAIQLLKLRLYEQAGDLNQQETLIRKLVDIYPKVPVFRISLVKIYIDQKRFDDAEKELREIAAGNPSDVGAGLAVVRFLQQVKGPAAAREELLARIKAGTEVFKYQMALAEFDLARGQTDDSIKLLEKLISSANSRDEKIMAQARLAQIQLSRRNLDAANALVTDILREDDRNIDGLKLRARVRMEQGQLDAAIGDLRQAINDQPQSSELMLLLATAYERSGSIELAEKEYADATKVSGFDATVGLNYAAFLRRRGNLERAEDLLTDFMRRWPNNVAVLSALADVRLARQIWVGAPDIAQNIQKIGNASGLSDQIMAAALSGEGKYSDSIRVLEGLHSASPTAVQPVAALVNTLVRAQKLDEAVSLLQTTLKANPANAEALVLLGSVQILKNTPDEAVKSFRAAIEQQPKDMAG